LKKEEGEIKDEYIEEVEYLNYAGWSERRRDRLIKQKKKENISEISKQKGKSTHMVKTKRKSWKSSNLVF
jgi:hypothetical protein